MSALTNKLETTIRLVIIDDDAFVCASLKTILDAQPDIDVVATGNNGAEAEALFRTHQPDILLTDIQMPERSGLDAARSILADYPDARIVLLTTFSDDEYIVSALRMGARGYLIKQDVATIAPSLRLVMLGQSVLGSEVLDRMDHLIHGDKPTSGLTAEEKQPARLTAAETRNNTSTTGSDSNNPFASLTTREYEVTELVASGLDNHEIARTLYISDGTVRNLISTILQKLDLKNRTQLAVLYYRQR